IAGETDCGAVSPYPLSQQSTGEWAVNTDMLLAGRRGGGDLPPEQRFCRPSLEQPLNCVALSPACRSDCRRQFVDDLTRLPGGPQTIGGLLQGRCVHPAMIAGKEPRRLSWIRGGVCADAA